MAQASDVAGRLLNVSANGRYFVGPDGRPVFFLGDTLWELFRLFEPDEVQAILAARQKQGFNAALVMLLGVNTARVEGILPGHVNVRGEKPWVNDDPATPNEKYFQHVDEVIGLGAAAGQTLIVGVFHQWQREQVTVEKARAWARWVSARYRDVRDLIWCMYPRAEEAYAPVCRELAAGLREGDGGAHLISVHPDPGVSSSSFLNDEPWLDFHMIQVCMEFEKIVDVVAADYARRPVRPVVMAEGAYEGVEFKRTQTAHDIRKQAYWSQLAGGHHVYGHNDAYAHPHDWRTWLEAPGVRSLGLFRQVITALPGWEAMVPDQAVLGDSVGTGFARNVAARAADGSWLAVYLSEPGTVTLQLWADGRATASGEWINPADGSRQESNHWRVPTQAQVTTPRGWADALLKVTFG